MERNRKDNTSDIFGQKNQSQPHAPRLLQEDKGLCLYVYDPYLLSCPLLNYNYHIGKTHCQRTLATLRPRWYPDGRSDYGLI